MPLTYRGAVANLSAYSTNVAVHVSTFIHILPETRLQAPPTPLRMAGSTFSLVYWCLLTAPMAGTAIAAIKIVVPKDTTSLRPCHIVVSIPFSLRESQSQIILVSVVL